MKQRHLQLSIALLLILAIAIIVWKAQRSAQLAAIDSQPEPVVIPTEMEEPHTNAAPASEPVAIATPAPAPEPAPAADEAVTSPEDVESITAIIEAVNPMSMQDIQRAVRKLRELPPEQVSASFMQSLKEFGTSRPADRDRLVMVANSLQSKTDLPFWEDLANRETPRYPEEDKVRNPPHPTLESRFVDMEQLQAIRNIGLLAREDRAARRVLMEIILKPNPSAHRTLHRQQAYTALKEADLAASLRVLKQLAAEDELLKRL
ncbi:hypothetical protein [Oligoflexus tunisiensis]|uniref:hypothetical protein n=1 Tax=Oligoflexus tunisiensis TaxID=708132 RepID=UPI00114C9BE3|nr:hypothetical protein [Oligoflexus tunisiensis]